MNECQAKVNKLKDENETLRKENQQLREQLPSVKVSPSPLPSLPSHQLNHDSILTFNIQGEYNTSYTDLELRVAVLEQEVLELVMENAAIKMRGRGGRRGTSHAIYLLLFRMIQITTRRWDFEPSCVGSTSEEVPSAVVDGTGLR